MAKAKAPSWQRQAFADGIDERHTLPAMRDPGRTAPVPRRAYPTAHPRCWLAHHDPKKLPCNFGPRGVFERFHFISRQRVETAMWSALIEAQVEEPCELCQGSGCNPNNVLAACLGCDGHRTWRAPLLKVEADDLILLAAWDPRNGDLACEHHHRRFDSHAGSTSAPAIVVPRLAVPDHVEEFGADYALEHELDRKFR